MWTCAGPLTSNPSEDAIGSILAGDFDLHGLASIPATDMCEAERPGTVEELIASLLVQVQCIDKRCARWGYVAERNGKCVHARLKHQDHII